MKNGSVGGDTKMSNELMFITPEDTRWFDLEDLPNEIWKNINGYEGLYCISNYSRIKHLPKFKNPREFIMKPYRDKGGRYIIYLWKNSKKKAVFVHRLVGISFIPNPGNKPEINHLRPVTKELCDNRVCNLVWATSAENSQWTKLCGNLYYPCLGKFGKNNHLSKPIVQLDINGNFIKEWENARQINRELDIDYRYISRNCKHKCHTAHGFIFMFKEEYYEQMGNHQ